jgi:Tfp pilus assembly protein FimT
LYKRSRHAAGFSLFELLIVIALITTLSLLVTSTYTWLNQLSVRAEVDSLYNTCRYLQRYAQLTGKQQELIFNQADGTFSYHTHTHTLPKHVSFAIIDGTKGPPSSPTTVIKDAITFLNSRIIFYPDGIIQSGTVYLVDSTKQYLFAVTSPVASVSYIRKYHYVHGKWQLMT